MKNILIFIFISFYTNDVCSQTSMDSVLLEYYRSIIKALTADSLGGRPPSSIYEDKTASFILREFKKNKKFKSKIIEFKYQIKDSIEKKSKNVYCYINNNADSTILISAHYDHLGLGSNLSYSYNKIAIHPGADDNASGVSLLLGLLKNYQVWSNKKYNYIFVSYSAHEIGLFGSANFFNYSIKNFKSIELVINFDMVGRLDKIQPVLNIYGVNTLAAFNNYLNNIDFKGKVYTDESYKIYDTDARSFCNAGIKSLSFTTGTHNDYHKITDLETYINYQGILEIQKFIEDLLKK